MEIHNAGHQEHPGDGLQEDAALKPDGIAFFDLDGTITRKDTFIDFIRFVNGRTRFAWGLFRLSPYILLFLIRKYPNHRLKERFFRTFLSPLHQDTLKKLGEKYGREKLPLLVYAEAMQRIRWHIDAGHRVVILTASSHVWLEHWCAVHGLELIGTRFEVSNGFYTGRIEGENCQGLVKQHIVRGIIEGNRDAKTYGYGDTHWDLPFLSIVDHSHYKPFRT
jgi:phosphatidylglycerophosphatase C